MTRFKDDLYERLSWSRERPEETFFNTLAAKCVRKSGGNGQLEHPSPCSPQSRGCHEQTAGHNSNQGAHKPALPAQQQHESNTSPCRRSPRQLQGNMHQTRIRHGVSPYNAIFSTTHKPDVPLEHKRPDPVAVEQELGKLAANLRSPTRQSAIWPHRSNNANIFRGQRPGTAPACTNVLRQKQQWTVTDGQLVRCASPPSGKSKPTSTDNSSLSCSSSTVKEAGLQPRPASTMIAEESRAASPQLSQASNYYAGHARSTTGRRPSTAPVHCGIQMNWEKSHHTNQMSKLFSLGSDKVDEKSCSELQETATNAGRRRTSQAGSVATRSCRHRSTSGCPTQDMSTADAVKNVLDAAEKKSAFTRMQHDHVLDQMSRLQNGLRKGKPMPLFIPGADNSPDMAGGGSDDRRQEQGLRQSEAGALKSQPPSPKKGEGHHRMNAVAQAAEAALSPSGKPSSPSPASSPATTALMHMMAKLSKERQGENQLDKSQTEARTTSLNPKDHTYIFRKSTDEHLRKALAAVAAREIQANAAQQAQEQCTPAVEQTANDPEALVQVPSLDNDQHPAHEEDMCMSPRRARNATGLTLTFAESKPGSVQLSARQSMGMSPRLTQGHAHKPPSRGVSRQASRSRSMADLKVQLSQTDIDLPYDASFAFGLPGVSHTEALQHAAGLPSALVPVGSPKSGSHQAGEAEDEAQYQRQLKGLKADDSKVDVAHSEQVGTYTGLVKPSHATVSVAAHMGACDGWDPACTLNWASRGVGARKLPELQKTLWSSECMLTALQLSGNTLDNDCVKDLLIMLNKPGAPCITQLDLSMNTALTWQVTAPIALALGCPAGDDVEKQLMAVDIRPLKLRRLVLSGLKLGDRGAAQLGQALTYNKTLRELKVSRCGIGEGGGRALLQPLASAHHLMSLDASWNTMSGEAAVALQVALATNCSLQRLVLNNNAFSDLDAARILAGLQNHGHWRHVDLSYNNVGAGAMLVLSQLCEKLAQAAAASIRKQQYLSSWEDMVVAGAVDTSWWFTPPGMSFHTNPSLSRCSSPTPGNRSVSIRFQGDDSGGSGTSAFAPLPASPSSHRNSGTHHSNTPSSIIDMPARSRVPSAVAPASQGSQGPTTGKTATLGKQLIDGPVLLELAGNPLGWTGACQLLQALDHMSVVLETSVTEAFKADPTGPLSPDTPCPWPIYLTINACNIALRDSLPISVKEGKGGAGLDLTSPNPFLQSLHAACMHTEGGAALKKDTTSSKKPDSGRKGSGRAGAKPSNSPGVDYYLTQSSQALDLGSPAGKYQLDLAHPGAAALVYAIKDLKQHLQDTAAEGNLCAGVSLMFKDLQLNGRTVKEDTLSQLLETTDKGILTFYLTGPSMLITQKPVSLSDSVVGWVVDTVVKGDGSDLFKLGFIEVACSNYYLTPPQALLIYDPDMTSSERLKSAEQLYCRTLNPVSFWEEVMPALPPQQAAALRNHLSDVGALDIERPCGRFSLNLSRTADRLIALRLQEAACLERPWIIHKYYLSWRNVTLNGIPISKEALTKLRDWTIPTDGQLKLDYVSYKTPPTDATACSDQEVAQLLSDIRSIHREYRRNMLAVQEEYLPYGQTRTSRTDSADRSVSQARTRRAVKAGKPKVMKELTRKLKDLAAELAGQTPPAAAVQETEVSRPTTPNKSKGSSATSSANDQAWWASTGFDARALLKQLADADSQRATRAAAKAAARRASDAAGIMNGGRMSTSGGRVSTPGKTVTITGGSHGPSMSGSEKPVVEAGMEKPARKESGRKNQNQAPRGAGAQKCARDVPAARLPGVCGSESERKAAEELAARLLMMPSPTKAAQLLSRSSSKHLARALMVFMNADVAKGAAIACRILEAMNPTAAAYILFDMWDTPMQLLPLSSRKAILSALRPDILKQLDTVQREINTLAMARSRRVRQAVTCFAAHNTVTAQQITSILKYARWEQDRVAATITLWGCCVDRTNLYNCWRGLSFNEQRQVLSRLGYWHIWTSIEARPEGIHWYLDLTDPEQRDVAREVVRCAVKGSQKAKEAAKKAGSSSAPQQMLNLHGNGMPLAIPEDEKTWSMIESSYQTIECDYAPTAQQVLQAQVAGVRVIQASWRHTMAITRAMASGGGNAEQMVFE